MKMHQFDIYGVKHRFDHHLTKVFSVRLSDEELCILNRYFPGENLSFQMRSAIHALGRHGELSQG